MEDIGKIRLSFSRFAHNDDVIGRFYDIFLNSHNEVKQRFVSTDFNMQKHSLRHSINLAIMFAEGKQIGEQGVKRIRKKHNKLNLNIPSHLYPYWKESLLQAIAKFDPQFSDLLKHEWDYMLQKTIDYIILVVMMLTSNISLVNLSTH